MRFVSDFWSGGDLVMSEFDPVDECLQSLRSELRSGIAPNREIEERLMTEYRQQHTPGGFRRYRSLVIALSVVLIGGVGFAATGGTEFVRQFVKVRLRQRPGRRGRGLRLPG